MRWWAKILLLLLATASVAAYVGQSQLLFPVDGWSLEDSLDEGSDDSGEGGSDGSGEDDEGNPALAMVNEGLAAARRAFRTVFDSIRAKAPA